MYLIREHDLASECQVRIKRVTGGSACLMDHFPDWDDGSDVEDPEDPAAVAAASAVADQQALVEAVGSLAEHGALKRENERLRMRLEDAR